MIQSARFTNVNGMYVDFNTNDIPFTRFVTEVDMRFTEKPRSQQHGIYPANLWMGRRLFHCEGDLFAANSAQYIERRLNMVGALMPRPQFDLRIVGVLDILFDGMSEHVTSDCTLDGYPELPMEASSPARSAYQVNWKAFDPRLYGAYQSVDIAYNANWQNIGGRIYDKVYDKVYTTTAGSQGETLIVNSGNIETYPLLAFYGPATSPAATMTRSDGKIYRFSLTGLVLADVNDYVVVDMASHSVVRGDGTNLYNYAKGSDWWALEPEPITNVVTYTGGPLAVPSHMSIQWRSAYML